MLQIKYLGCLEQRTSHTLSKKIRTIVESRAVAKRLKIESLMRHSMFPERQKLHACMRLLFAPRDCALKVRFLQRAEMMIYR